jgi:hypothetical protein
VGEEGVGGERGGGSIRKEKHPQHLPCQMCNPLAGRGIRRQQVLVRARCAVCAGKRAYLLAVEERPRQLPRFL